MWTDDEVDLIKSQGRGKKPASQSILTFWICSQLSVSILPLKMLHSSAKSFHTNTLYTLEWVDIKFQRFASLFSKRSGYTCQDLLRFQKFPLQGAFSKVGVYSVRFRRYVWTESVSATKCLRMQRIRIPVDGTLELNWNMSEYGTCKKIDKIYNILGRNDTRKCSNWLFGTPYLNFSNFNRVGFHPRPTVVRFRRAAPAVPLPGNFYQSFSREIFSVTNRRKFLYTGMPYNLFIVLKSLKHFTCQDCLCAEIDVYHNVWNHTRSLNLDTCKRFYFWN
jgi:hypothetical protein